MKACSAFTKATDSYRAGLELGNELLSTQPEVIFLFSTIHYSHSAELIEGVYDAIENENIIIIGNTGDGCYESKGPMESGAAALGLNSEGRVKWHLLYESGIADSPKAVTQTLIRRLANVTSLENIAFSFLVSDFHTDATEIESAIQEITAFPIVGGLAADDNQMKKCVLYANNKMLTDAAVLLAAEGDIRFDISIGNSLTPIGKTGTIDKAKGTDILSIDGRPAMDFMEREMGKPVLQSDRGVTTLTIIDEDQPDIKRLRSIVPNFSSSEQTLGLYGGIEEGRSVQVCQAEPKQLIQEVVTIATKAKESGFQPAAAIIVSCSGRKWVLGDDIKYEISSLSDNFDSPLPIVGFPSFGEIGPLKTESGYTRNLFHNMTYVLLLIGQ